MTTATTNITAGEPRTTTSPPAPPENGSLFLHTTKDYTGRHLRGAARVGRSNSHGRVATLGHSPWDGINDDWRITALAHELGHVLGLNYHKTGKGYRDHLMYEYLEGGEILRMSPSGESEEDRLRETALAAVRK